MLQFPKFEIVLKRGEIRVNGYADLAKGKGEVDYFSNADLEQFAAVGGLGTAGFKEFHGAKPLRFPARSSLIGKHEGIFMARAGGNGEFRVGKNVYRKLVSLG